MLKIVKKMTQRQNNNYSNPGVTVAFLGDSVTQGCFEVYRKSEKELECVFDKTSAYHKYIADIFSVIYPTVPVNIINAGISGSSAQHTLPRIERDVLCHNPDLVVVCFGLNDSNAGLEKLSEYTDGLRQIFEKIRAAGTDVIFMTPNMKCTSVSCRITDELIREDAAMNMRSQSGGVMDKYMDSARKLCKSMSIPVCDCYKKWKRLEECGVDITELLANRINHPTREMNWLFAYSLVETIMSAN